MHPHQLLWTMPGQACISLGSRAGEITVSWVPVLIIREVLDAVVHLESLLLRNQKRLVIIVTLQHPFRRAARNDDAASEILVEMILLAHHERLRLEQLPGITDATTNVEER